MVAGPSEVLVMADESANPVFVAADLMSQAEHDVLASAVLLTTSETLAEKYRLKSKDRVQIFRENQSLIHRLRITVLL